MKKKIAILADFDIAKRPRPFRLAMMLKDKYDICAIARECSFVEGIQCFSFPAPKTSKDRTEKENQDIINYCKNKEFDKLIYTPNRMVIFDILKSLPLLDVIVIEDIALLPFAIEYRKFSPNTKILIDLREYYPLEYEKDSLWLKSFGVFFEHLCQKYLPLVDKAIVVNGAIGEKYRNVFGIDVEVFYSFPPFVSLDPSRLTDTIKIIYHGFLSPDRHSHNLLEIAKNLDKHFCLYVMGLSNQKDYLEDIKHSAYDITNLKFLPPVDMKDIVTFCNQFDIGILTLQPNSFNNANALPNKFFEYIQSRLCVVSTPLFEIKKFIDKYKIGRTSEGFDAKDIVQTLNNMDKKTIFSYKENASKASYDLSMNTNISKIISIIEGLIF
ncbi:capsular biosynthesis protein [Helicobacter cappadocius]|uniref:Capsular biosynthesis protein n=1 Tax=Helicobacter cappadocius TaxID=3063998 RepID=A0AA90PRS7_9HELI|nr:MULTISPECIES: capsular biosynthesis protein [unclassified Helicobacter]MDO7252437.1 capsular biosynthesis protein [Helicobacter sp. faydin-H75]MDP2538304.1 capsular biosynthesis protein [Helicobacter sp. faydin-H76]